MEFNQIITADSAELTADQQDFLQLHKQIIANGNAASAYLLETSKLLKEMRDTKKYLAGGFVSFDEYAQTACGIGQRQAYNMISIVENLGEAFLHSYANLGVSKLTLIAAMSERDRNDMMHDHAEQLSDMSTRQIAELKKSYEDRIKQMSMDMGALQEENRALRDQSEQAEKQDDHSEELKAQKKELAEAKKKLKAAEDDRKRAVAEEKARMQKAIDEAVAQAKAAKERADQEVQAIREKAMESMRQQEIAADPLMSEFKANFELWQVIYRKMIEIIGKMEQDRAVKCKTAVAKLMEMWK